MKLRLLSDIHLELANNGLKYMKRFIPITPTPNDVLLLAGDIGNPAGNLYKLFITEMSKHYAKVFIVTGNHEYYQSYQRARSDDFSGLGVTYIKGYRHSMEQIDNMIATFTATLPNVHFLQRTSIIHNRVRFMGCTLWTPSDYKLSDQMNDYNCIKDMTTEKCREIHLGDVSWLTEQLAEISSDYDATVVMTHHLPSYQLLADKYIGDPLNVFYANTLEKLVEQADIWVCGHSHTAKHITIGKCECYLNPTGYIGEHSGYQPNIDITLAVCGREGSSKEEVGLNIVE